MALTSEDEGFFVDSFTIKPSNNYNYLITLQPDVEVQMQLNQEAISCEEADCSCEENKCIFDLESIYDAPLPAREISLIDITPRSITVYETDPRQRIMSETIVTDNGKLAVQVSN